MLPVTIVVVFVPYAWSPKALATNRGKVIDWKCMEGGAQARRHAMEGRGFESRCWQKLSYHEISVKANF